MGLTIGHVKNVTVADGTDTGVVRPSDWNSVHAVTLSLANNEVVKYIAAGTNSVSSGTVSFGDSNGVTFGMDTAGVITGSVATNYQSAGAYLTTAALSNHSHAFATTTTNGASIIVGTTNSNGVTIGVPAYLTTAQAPGAYLTTARASNDAIGLNTALTANGVSVTADSRGLSINVPAFLTTAMASNAGSNFFATSNNTFANSTHTHGAFSLATTNINGTVNSASNGLTLSLSVPEAADTWAAVGNTIAGTATSGSFSNDSYWVSGGGIISVGVSSNSLVISASAAGGTINQTGPNIAAAGSTVTAGTVVFSNSNGVSFGLNGSTMTASVGNASISDRWQYPPGALTALSAFGNGSFSVQRIQMEDALVATRLDVPVLWSLGTVASANTWGFVMTAIGGVYSKNASTLSQITSNSTTYGFTLASNSAGSTQMTAPAVRPVSIPLNFTGNPGEYYVGFGISTNTSSAGTATTALGLSISAMGGMGYSNAVGHVGDFTQATNTSTGLYGGGPGVYSAAFSTAPPNLSLSAINVTGSYYSRGNIGVIFRNQA